MNLSQTFLGVKCHGLTRKSLSRLFILPILLTALATGTARGQGETWKWINPSPFGSHLFDVAMSGGTALAIGSHGSIMRSADSGKTWTEIKNCLTGNRLRDLAFVDSGTAFVVGDAGAFLNSSDTGKTWQSVSQPAVSPYGWMALAFNG